MSGLEKAMSALEKSAPKCSKCQSKLISSIYKLINVLFCCTSLQLEQRQFNELPL